MSMMSVCTILPSLLDEEEEREDVTYLIRHAMEEGLRVRRTRLDYEQKDIDVFTPPSVLMVLKKPMGMSATSKTKYLYIQMNI